jgi:excisionase family DNA binding protein
MTPLATITTDHARRARPGPPSPRQRLAGSRLGVPYPKRRLRLAYSAPASPTLGAIHPTGGETSDHHRPFTPLIDAKAAGELLGVPHTWLLAQARAGRIPHHRLGHYVRFNTEDMKQWLIENRIAPDSSRRARAGGGF